jgi:lysophospholipase L1-like esterase
MREKIFLLLICLCSQNQIFAITPNAKISTGKTVYTSSGNAAYLVDNNFTGSSFNVSANTWIAINLNVQKSSVYFSWNNPGYSWSDEIAKAGSCKQNTAIPTNYTIQKSNNSTNGTDGTWTTVATITSNLVTARAHTIDFSGAKWLKMNITSGGGQINEIEVFDIQSWGQDLWFFPGTSISANTYKGSVPAKNYADLIKQNYPSFTPSMVRGGIPCINSSQFKADINLYLAAAGNAKFWAIEMGTNDGYNNGNSNVATFKSNMQSIITACKNAGIQPIIAKVIATNQTAAGWQIHADYGKAVDDLTTQNNLIAGPDLYTYFLNHPSELNSDGVHPNATGAASIQRLWAEKMGPLLYATVTSVEKNISSEQLSVYPNPCFDLLKVDNTNQVFSYSITNSVGVECQNGESEGDIDVSNLLSGIYILTIKRDEKIDYSHFEKK